MKKRIAIVNGAAHGHVNPTLGITEELVRRGHDVVYLVHPAFQAKVEATGARFISYGASMPHLGAIAPEEFRKNFAQGRFALMLKEWDKTAPHLKQLLDDFRPDTVMYDFFVNPAHRYARETGTSAVKFFTTYAASKDFNLWDEIRKWSPQSMPDPSLPMADLMMMMEPADTNLVFIPRAFHHKPETFDKTYHFVGPCLRSQETGADAYTYSGTRPLVLATMGSVLTKQPRFYQTCFEAFRARSEHLVLGIGADIDPSALGAAPQNVTMLHHVPQLSLLRKASGFISHGGMNSTMEALAFGVSLVVIPQTEEQEATARRVHDLKVGVFLERDKVTAAALNEALERILTQPEYTVNAQKMAAAIQESGGTREAVVVIEGVAAHQP